MGCDGIGVRARTHLLLGLLRNDAQVLQKPLGIQKRLGGAVDSTALRMAEDQHQAAAQIARAELQAANNAAFCLSYLLRLSGNRFCNLACGQKPTLAILIKLHACKCCPRCGAQRCHLTQDTGWKFRSALLFPASNHPL